MSKTFLQPSYIELDEEALADNFKYLRRIAAGPVKISSVIKGNAYGHGISTYLPMAERCGINHFSVFSASEAVIALESSQNPETDLMIMGMIREDELEWAIENEIEFYLFETKRLDAAISCSKKTGKKAKVHLEIETGMNRTGFEEEQWDQIFTKIKAHSSELKLMGICTHYAGAESVANFYRIQNQNYNFKKAVKKARSVFGNIPVVHSCSSAAFLTLPDMHYDMVRIGIAQFGFWPSRETYMDQMKRNLFDRGADPLKRVMTWKSEVMSTKWVDEGEFIGYGNFYMTGRRMRIATVPIGYSHGFGRDLTNSGYVLIHGERAGVVGLVNMNMITVDITNITDAQKGDTVVLIGKQGSDEITVASFGEMTNNLNYEVLTRLPSSIPREAR
ncbi:MAG: alanine racemase [Balneolaceae bacterium]